MVEEEKEEEGEEEGESKEKNPKKGKKSIIKWIVVFLGVVILGAAGFAGWTYYKTHISGSEKAGSEQTVQTGIWSMGSLVVNLMDADGERYLKAVIQIEVSNQDCISEMDLLKPKITDSILGLLSSKSYKEIAGFEGKQRLRDEIAMRLNGYLTKGQVRRVYFTEFLIQ